MTCCLLCPSRCGFMTYTRFGSSLHQSSDPLFPSANLPSVSTSHTLIYGGPHGIRILLVEIMSLASCRYTVRPLRRVGMNLSRRIRRVAVLMQSQRRGRIGWRKPHMYEEMRRIRACVQLPLFMITIHEAVFALEELVLGTKLHVRRQLSQRLRLDAGMKRTCRWCNN